MTELSRKNTLAMFEHTREGLPQLSAETPASGAEQATPELAKPEVRSIRVAKLDQLTIWRMIDLLKSL